tara:strand:+ start:908 stop:2191 length:1284 start_codon:yes stop_codon:yes gene_type:complete
MSIKRKINSNKLFTKDLLKFLLFIFFLFTFIYTLYSLFSYASENDQIVSFIGIKKIKYNFGDLRQLTYSSSCVASFSQLMNNYINCDPLGRPFNYTRFSLWLFRLLKIGQNQTHQVGLIMGLITIFTSIGFTLVTLKNKRNILIILSIFFLSYPLQLCLERGNYDQLIFVGSLLLPLLYQRAILNRQREINLILAAIISFGITALKLFPLLGILPWTFFSFLKLKNKKLFYIPLIIFVFSLIGFIFQIGDISLIAANTPNPNGKFSFGFGTGDKIISENFSFIILIFKIFIILISIKIFEYLKINFNKKFYFQNYENNLAKEAAIFFSFMILFAYFLNNSFDYRLIFVFGILPYFINQNQLKKFSFKVILLSLIYISFEQYLFPFFYIGNIFRLFSDLVLQPFLIGFIICFLIKNQLGKSFNKFYLS